MLKAEYVDHMGSDLTVVNAARVSFDKHHDVLDLSDTKLLRYLASHGHWTPYAHPQIQLRMTAPVCIRTQCFKHKIGFVENEVSRRYVSDTPEFYYPDVWRSAPTNGAKQGSGSDVINYMWFEGIEEGWTTSPSEIYSNYIDTSIRLYDQMIKEGIAPEMARMVLPQSMLTSFYWTGSLKAYANFFNLRTDAHAQKEIQDLAHMVGDIIEPLFPESWKVLTNA